MMLELFLLTKGDLSCPEMRAQINKSGFLSEAFLFFVHLLPKRKLYVGVSAKNTDLGPGSPAARKS